MRLAGWLIGAALAVAPGLAAADEPTGCDAFKWPLDHERAALMNSGKPAVANGGALTADAAATLKLTPFAEAGSSACAGARAEVAAILCGPFCACRAGEAGIYKITIASEGWIDVIDAGQFLHPKAFSGALGCEGARKSVKFDLPARPLDLQLSDVKNGEISVIVSPE